MTAKGDGLLAGILTLIHGLYLPLISLLGLILTILGFKQLSPSLPEFLTTLVLIDTVVYVALGMGMIIEERRDFFLFASLWTLFGVALAAFWESYKTPALNFLSFLIVFTSTYHYVKKVHPPSFKYLRLSSGILALVQVVYLAFGLVLSYFLGLFIFSLIISVVVYIALSVGIIRGSREFFFYAVLWTIIESGFAVYSSYFNYGALSNFVSMLILFFCTYSYWGKRE